MHDAAATFTHEKARKFDKDVKIENKSCKTWYTSNDYFFEILTGQNYEKI